MTQVFFLLTDLDEQHWLRNTSRIQDSQKQDEDKTIQWYLTHTGSAWAPYTADDLSGGQDLHI